MKIFGLILVITLAISGCATFNHSEYIDTDQLGGYASGKYQYSGTGPVGNFTMAGTGGGWGAGGAGGFGLGAVSVTTGPAQISPYKWARSVAMVNYSKKLKSIKYDEAGGIIEYEFEQMPGPRTSSIPAARSQLSPPSSFGHQPIE